MTALLPNIRLLKKKGRGSLEQRKPKMAAITKANGALTSASGEPYLIRTHWLKVSDAFIALYKDKGMKGTNASLD